MSIMKGKLRRSAVVVAFSLGAFQALSVVGATMASAAATTCSFSGGVLTVGFTGAGHWISQDVPGNILVDGVKTSATAIPTCSTSVDATTANTTAININGTPGATLTDDAVAIWTYVGVTSADWGTINWVVNLGDNGALPVGGDSFTVDNSLNTDDGVETDWGVAGVDLNGDGDVDVALVGVEKATDIAGAGDATLGSDTVNAGGTTATGAAFPTSITIDGTAGLGDEVLTGGSGDDTVTGGAGYNTIAGGLGNDSLDGGVGGGAVDFTGSLTAVTVDLGAGTASGEGFDSLANFQDINGSDHGDTLTGDAGTNWIAVGIGNDTVDGVSGANDTYDVASATAAVTVDLGAGTSTGGSGTDTLKHIDDVSGSDFNDSLTGGAGDNVLYGEGGNDALSGGAGDKDGADSFDGGSGIDTLDYSANTLDTTVNLFALATANNCAIFSATADCGTGGVSGGADLFLSDTIENAKLGTGNDTFNGSVFNNIAFPNGGQNSLSCVVGGCGGIDTVNYSIGYTAGVTINLSGGGGTGGASDSISGFQNAVGTAFNDTMFGTDVVLGTNGANLLVGGKGNDTISANAGPDLVRAGAGNDRVRGGSGDDTLKGQGGKDNIRGGQGDDDIFGGKGKDFCVGGAGHDLIKTCERPRHNHQGPNGPGVASRLAAIKP
jgi:hypothetical protein